MVRRRQEVALEEGIQPCILLKVTLPTWTHGWEKWPDGRQQQPGTVEGVRCRGWLKGASAWQGLGRPQWHSWRNPRKHHRRKNNCMWRSNSLSEGTAGIPALSTLFLSPVPLPTSPKHRQAVEWREATSEEAKIGQSRQRQESAS